MKVVLYKGVTCPICKVIAKKLEAKNIPFEAITDVDYMISKGITTVPTLEVDGVRYVDGVECKNWINSYEVGA